MSWSRFYGFLVPVGIAGWIWCPAYSNQFGWTFLSALVLGILSHIAEENAKREQAK